MKNLPSSRSVGNHGGACRITIFLEGDVDFVRTLASAAKVGATPVSYCAAILTGILPRFSLSVNSRVQPG